VCIDEHVDLIIRETDRLNSILQDYLTACKKPSFNPVNIHEVMEKTLKILNIPMKKAGVTLNRFYDPSLPHVMGDEGKLLQVFLNIIKNAVESIQKGDKIEICTYPSKELFGEHGKIKRMALVSIKDTGKGIPADDIQKIFIPFYTKKKYGAGIGLALSKKIIRDHGGLIKVKSQKNKGTTLYIYLPFGHNG
jgi:nitrogen-specific signal transduction histidine kinase